MNPVADLSIVPPKPELAAQRSPHWPAVRDAHLLREPVCQVCGGLAHLQVHHIEPYHIRPDLELSPTNLITLCESPGVNCHYVYGHSRHWLGWNVKVRADVATARRRITASAKLAEGDAQ